MKVIRLFLRVNDKRNVQLNRPYDNKLTDEENCDNAMRWVAECMDKKYDKDGRELFTIAAVKEDSLKNPRPAFIRMESIDYVVINNVAVYTVEKVADISAVLKDEKKPKKGKENTAAVEGNKE